MKICKVDDCKKHVNSSTRSTLCGTHFYNFYTYHSYDKPEKKFKTGIVKICKKHGELKENQTIYIKNHLKKYYFKCKKCHLLTTKKTSQKTTEKRKKGHFNKIWYSYYLKYKFNITMKQYEDMLKEQQGKCKICNKEETMKKRNYDCKKMLSIDHCHITGKIRGLLCHRCNVALGSFKDSIEILESAIHYLRSQ
jgi:hypothetical protein